MMYRYALYLRQGLALASYYLRSPRYKRETLSFLRESGIRTLDDLQSQAARLSDDQWFWMHAFGPRSDTAIRKLVPLLPAAKLQRQITGSAGARNLLQAFSAQKLFRSVYEQFRGPIHDAHLCDFGAGWGRIARFFVRDLAADQLTLYEPSRQLAELARASLPYQVVQTPPWPPVDTDPERFDMIYSWSVFSHFGENIHLAWISEFHRLLKPGGLIALTTRPRSAISLARSLHGGVNADRSLFRKHQNEYVARYDAGEYCHSSSNDGDPRSSTWGETCIPREYAAKNWPGFALLDVLRAENTELSQDIIVARRVESA